MTTEPRPPAVLPRTALATGVAGAVLVGVAAVLAGSSAAAGAAVGAVLAVAVFVFGAFAVDAVARLLPGASLMFAMLTYTLQVVVMALAFVALNRSGLLGSELDRGWLGGAIILGALVWTAVQLRLATTTRIPVYDTTSEAGAR